MHSLALQWQQTTLEGMVFAAVFVLSQTQIRRHKEVADHGLPSVVSCSRVIAGLACQCVLLTKLL